MTASHPSTKKVSPYEKERQRFERWFRRYWNGIDLHREKTCGEYTQTAAQTAWEVWWRFSTRAKR